jgi:hypothetical protein
LAALWQASAETQQTVASIMNLRGQTADACLAATQAACQATLQCRMPTDVLGVWGQWYERCVTECVELTINTQLARATLWQSWQHQLARQLSSTPDSLLKIIPNAALSTTAPALVASTAPQPPAAAPVVRESVRSTSVPASTSSQSGSVAAPQPTTAIPMTSSMPAPVTPAVAPVAVTSPAPTALPTLPPLVPQVASTPVALPLPTVSRTGDAAVVRSGNGATIAAASATRRSVLARRQQRKSGLARAR